MCDRSYDNNPLDNRCHICDRYICIGCGIYSTTLRAYCPDHYGTVVGSLQKIDVDHYFCPIHFDEVFIHQHR